MSSDEDDIVAVGAVIKPHGLKGEVRVHPFNEASRIWPKLKQVFLARKEGDPEAFVVRRARRAAKYAILELEGVVGRDAAEALRGREVLVPRSVLPGLDPDEFYLVDLIGASVVRDGETVGVVAQVFEYPSCLCVQVRSDDGVREVPMIEPWVVGIDMQAHVIEVGPWDDVPIGGQ